LAGITPWRILFSVFPEAVLAPLRSIQPVPSQPTILKEALEPNAERSGIETFTDSGVVDGTTFIQSH